MPYSFWIEETDYTATGNYEYIPQNSGYLQIQDNTNPGNETIELPFLWWFSHWSYYYNPWFNWWQGELTASEPTTPDYMDDLQFIKYEDSSTYGTENFYYLIVPKTETDYFKNLEFWSADLDEYDPTIDPLAFASILGEGYEVDNVTYSELGSELGICDLADCSPATSVPEASSVMGVLAIGVAVVGVAIKRKFFPKHSAKAS